MNITSCRGCDAQIVFLRKPREDGSLAPHPVDAATVKPGDVLFDSERHTSHFDTCPEAWRFRRRPVRPAASKPSAKPSTKRPAEPVQLDLFAAGGGA